MFIVSIAVAKRVVSIAVARIAVSIAAVKRGDRF
jgi:hypothetical protein